MRKLRNDEQRIKQIYVWQDRGRRLRAAREAAGAGQKALAHAIGTSPAQVAKFEQGKNRMGDDQIFYAAEFLKIPVQRLFPPRRPKRRWLRINYDSRIADIMLRHLNFPDQQ